MKLGPGDWVLLLGAVTALLGAGKWLAGLPFIAAQKRKIDAETDGLRATTSVGLFGAAEKAMEMLEATLDRQAKQIAALEARAEQQENEMDRLRDGEETCQRNLAAALERVRVLEAAKA